MHVSLSMNIINEDLILTRIKYLVAVFLFKIYINVEVKPTQF